MTNADATAQVAATQLVPVAKLLSFAQHVLTACGVTEEDAQIVAECLTYANLSGIDSHGVVRLAHYVRRLDNGTIKARPEISYRRTAPAVGLLDGGDGLGHVVTYRACSEAMQLAQEAGSGLVGVANSSHFGMTGFYINRLVAAGYGAMMMTTTDAFLIPFGGRKSFWGTNPLAIGFPKEGIPVVLDMATTSIPYGKIALAKTEGRAIPPDWGLDEEGNPTTDPNRIAGLYPIAGPKGSGLAMIIDIFSCLLSGMPYGPHVNKMYTEMDQPRKLGHFVMAFDIARFVPLEAFKARLAEMCAELNAVPPAAGFTRVFYPGQVEGETRERRGREGIPIDPGLYAELEGLGKRFGLPFPG